MFLLIRMAFWLTVVLVLLPSGGTKRTAAAPGAEINAVEAVSAASATVSDMRHFCSRQPEACAIGSQAAVAIGQRAQAGAKMVYEMINERTADTGAAAPKGAKPAGPLATRPSQNTLTPADLAPAWRGTHRDAQGQRGA